MRSRYTHRHSRWPPHVEISGTVPLACTGHAHACSRGARLCTWTLERLLAFGARARAAKGCHLWAHGVLRRCQPRSSAARSTLSHKASATSPSSSTGAPPSPSSQAAAWSPSSASSTTPTCARPMRPRPYPALPSHNYPTSYPQPIPASPCPHPSTRRALHTAGRGWHVAR